MAITRDQIFAIADQLDSEGNNPTLAKVRKQLGGGSYTTISEVMAEWKVRKFARSAQSQREPLPQQLVERLGDFGGDLWQLALELATIRYSAEREAQEVVRTEQEVEKREAVELADHLSAEVERLQERERLLEATETKLHAECEILRSQHLAIAERAVKAEARAEEIEKRVSDLNTELARVNAQNASLVTALTSVSREKNVADTAVTGAESESAGAMPEQVAKSPTSKAPR